MEDRGTCEGVIKKLSVETEGTYEGLEPSCQARSRELGYGGMGDNSPENYERLELLPN